jgi:hypothetical protein
MSVRSTSALALAAHLGATSLAGAQAAKTELPLKYAAKPTTEEITAADLMSRLYVFADDSLMGREVGTKGNDMGTAIIEAEVRRLGLVPAGDNGGYFQNLPLFSYYVDPTSAVSVGGQAMRFSDDFMAIPREDKRISLEGLPVIFGGSTADSTTWLSPEDAAGKILVLSVPSTSSPIPQSGGGMRARVARAAAVFLVSLDRLPANVKSQLVKMQALKTEATPPAGTPTFFISQRFALSIFNSMMDSVKTGAAGRPLTGTLILRQEQAPGRNVVAIIPGSDPKLKGQYVAIGAHNDHIGLRRQGPVDHDSMKVFNFVARPQGEDSPNPQSLSDKQKSTMRRMLDSLRALRPVRMDSVYNGADDDGSGSMTVLEIAEAFAKSKVKPKRSILFVWHAGEEKGLWGSEYYTDHPTVPRDSIVAQLNMDMVGRGSATDATGESASGSLLYGGPGYLQLVGSRRLSTELGDLMESVNTLGRFGLKFDYGMDANGHPQVIYCRSDHYEYARYGIPIVFMTTGGHSDYHQVTDEPQYIDYPHMAEIGRYVKEVATTVANLDHRVVVDKPKPDPKGRCVQ